MIPPRGWVVLDHPLPAADAYWSVQPASSKAMVPGLKSSTKSFW